MALTTPAGFQAVGIRGGKTQVANRGQDQTFIFNVLKAIPDSRGGARETLAGESAPIFGDRICDRFLYELILRFQKSSAELISKDGVVDPGGATFRRMATLAGVVGPMPPAPTPSGKVVPNTESGLPAQRHRIRQTALVWTQSKGGGGPYKPTAAELRGFFATAKTETVPTLIEADKSLKSLSTGCFIQGTAVRHWCGIFACAVAVTSGLTGLRWSLIGGKIVGSQLVMGNKDILPGDIAIIAAYSHHFIIMGFPNAGKVATLEGNTTGQLIRASERPVSSIVGFYRTIPL